MSRNILDELYDYDLFHLTEIEDMDGSYKTALDRLVKAETELKKAYPDNDEILDEYQSADIELHNLSNRNELRPAEEEEGADEQGVSSADAGLDII